MSTKSRIGILHEDGTTETVYCHWDGNPEHQMPILTGHYNSIEKVEELIDLGALSYLGEQIAPTEDAAADVTIAYHRDKGEPLTESQNHGSLEALKSSDWDIDWFYLFDVKNGAWLPPIKG